MMIKNPLLGDTSDKSPLKRVAKVKDKDRTLVYTGGFNEIL